MTTYIVVADAARARIFTRDALKLEEQVDLSHPEGRLHEGDLVTDQGSDVNNEVPVRSSNSSGEHDTAKQHETEIFARQVADRLYHARVDNTMDKLILVAPPRFLGQLRDKIDGPTAKLIIHTLAKDLTKASADDIKAAVSDLR